MSTSPPPSVLTKQRPRHPPRNSSFSRRHASFDTPREVPLPSVDPPAYSEEQVESDWTNITTTSGTSTGQQILPYPRPYSLPSQSSPTSPILAAATPSQIDRTSSASLPIPPQIPYHTLPKAAPVTEEDENPGPLPSPPLPEPQSQTQRPTSLPVPTPIPRPPSISRTRPSSSASSDSYPAPEPPTILPSQQPPAHSEPSLAPHEPFLSNAPPPPDSWIEVETTPQEYRLNVCLPGFKRDGITLATKRRRILHVVADSWDAGGGHFERRISFGYDADLVQVRAEFDGEMLRVIVPRRAPGSGAIWSS
ncbi:hypothetical protein F5146DRAFT_1024342 [Armillaria mellea]|nr:hypothetical protein F5146DRAFT_1024342 [Armillaria mellea]